MKNICLSILIVLLYMGCKKNEDPAPTPVEAQMVFKIRFDSTQQRLDNFGNPSTLAAGHAAQSPVFNFISTHYFEITKDSLTALGSGQVLDKGIETTAGGVKAIDFEKSLKVKNGEVILKVPLKDIAAGTYKWLRMSLAYQEYDVRYRAMVNNVNYDLSGRVASFIGYNTYIKSYNLNSQAFTVNGNRKQGFWAFQTNASIDTGQAAGVTTVPNPISKSSPIPPGSCVVTARFQSPLSITGKETEDIVIDVSLSNNKSFEWEDGNGNKIWEPLLGEKITDMGIRGMEVKRF